MVACGLHNKLIIDFCNLHNQGTLHLAELYKARLRKPMVVVVVVVVIIIIILIYYNNYYYYYYYYHYYY